MTEAEALAMRDIVQKAVAEAVVAAAGLACADLRVAIREELAPIRESLAALESLPGTVKTLSNHYLTLNAALESLQPLKPLIGAHREEIRELRIKLGYLEGMDPKLERVAIIVDQAVPRLERALDRIDAIANNQASMKSEIERVERESQRAAGEHQ